jgi:serine O-acetyltransferase
MTRPLRLGDLEQAIDKVVESYHRNEEIDNLESAALPNKRAVIEAFNHLTAVTYLGFYSTRALSRDNLRYAVSEGLYPAYEILVEQIERAITYEVTTHAAPRRAVGFSEAVVLRLLEGLPAIRRMLNGDVRAAFEGDPAAKSFEEIVFSYPAIRAITAYRFAHALYVEGVPLIPRIFSEYAHSETGIDIHPGATIGERFFIDHGTGVVIGETAVIGDDVKIYQGVTLGALSAKRCPGSIGKRRHPTIEDGVTIYAHATILGGDTVIGRGSVVGGNVWLVRSIPPESKVEGRARD